MCPESRPVSCSSNECSRRRKARGPPAHSRSVRNMGDVLGLWLAPELGGLGGLVRQALAHGMWSVRNELNYRTGHLAGVRDCLVVWGKNTHWNGVRNIIGWQSWYRLASLIDPWVRTSFPGVCVTLCTFNLHRDVSQLFLNKWEEKKWGDVRGLQFLVIRWMNSGDMGSMGTVVNILYLKVTKRVTLK